MLAYYIYKQPNSILAQPFTNVFLPGSLKLLAELLDNAPPVSLYPTVIPLHLALKYAQVASWCSRAEDAEVESSPNSANTHTNVQQCRR